ncbi:exodeoxyribonuclease V subunit beta [Actinobacillus equuli]|nr:exodeoxyribonuclease V subunit beta [Actinobacillus equuli]
MQYLLYTLALHRYLRVRLGEQYEYERDFGGVAYLFLRGMNGTPNSGVFLKNLASN